MENERELVLQCLANDVAAQRNLYDQFAPRMFGICLRYAKSEMDAEDILQNGFIRVFNKLHQFRFECPLERWIRTLIVSVAINHIHQFEKFNHHVELSNVNEQATFFPDPLSVLSMKEMMSFIRKLPTGRRTIFNLAVFDGYGHKEIASMLGIAEGTSKSQLARARRVLRGDLAEM